MNLFYQITSYMVCPVWRYLDANKLNFWFINDWKFSNDFKKKKIETEEKKENEINFKFLLHTIGIDKKLKRNE